MKTNITHASWMNPIDNGEWDGWNPAWMKAIMDHLDVETEEHVAGVFSTNEDPELVVDLLKHYGDNWTERQTTPYQDLRIGSLYFGSVSIQGIERPAVFWGNGDSDGSMYVATDHVRPLPIAPRDPETGLHPNHPGQGFDPYVQPAKPVIQVGIPTNLPCLGSVQQYESEGINGTKLVATNIWLPDNTIGITIDGGNIRVVTRCPAEPPTPANPAEDTLGGTYANRERRPAREDDIEDTYPVCDQCGVACPPSAHFGTAYGHYCAACYRDQTGAHPEPDEQPVGNVQPKDLYTPLFDEPEAP